MKTTKNFTVRVVDTKAPVITAKNRSVKINSTNAVSGVSAKMRSGKNVTSAMSVKIKAPGANSYTTYSYSKAKSYKFSKAGKYTVQYVAKNVNKPYRAATKTVTITVTAADAKMNLSKTSITVAAGTSDDAIISTVRGLVTINDNGTQIKGTSSNVKVTLTKDAQQVVTAAKVSYTGKNGKTVSKEVKVTVEQSTTEQPTTTEATTATTEAQN